MPQSYFQTVEHEGHAAMRRLQELGLGLDGLLRVVRHGEDARAQATKNDPRNAASLDAYRYRVRALRDVFCVAPYPWNSAYENGLEMIASLSGQRAIVTRAGDCNVGLKGTHPQPKREVGDMTAKRVSANGTLFLDPNWLNVGKVAIRGTETWFFLVRRGEPKSNDEDIVFSELSLPSGIDDDGGVSGWIERIVLPTIDLRDPGQRMTPQAPAELEDVPVIRKQRK